MNGGDAREGGRERASGQGAKAAVAAGDPGEGR